MKVALIGIGGVAKYLIDELTSRNHEIVAISRSRKAFLNDRGIKQHEVQYTAVELTPVLKDCDAVVCTISGASPNLVEIHAAILEASTNSPTCKRFIPSAWVGNFEDIPDQPIYGSEELQKIYRLLSDQFAIEWTFISLGWMIDYVLPSNQRYLPNIGEFWVQDHEKKTFKLYGTGSQKISCTTSRDTARAVSRLLETDVAWERFTYISGEQVTWLELSKIINENGPEYQIRTESLSNSIKQLMSSKDPFTTSVAVFNIMGHSEALHYPQERVDRHREKYFKGLRFRTVRELLEEAALNSNKVV